MNIKTIFTTALFLIVIGFMLFINNSSFNNIAEAKVNQKQKVLVAYFSATGTTKKVAENLAKATGGDLYEIKPLKPYTSADLDWRNKESRSSVEMKNLKSRPEIVTDDLSIEKYDTIYLGFPIWWGIAPRIINTFLEKHDFSDKTIILFATSGSAGNFGRTVNYIEPSVSDSAKIVELGILNGNPSVGEIKNRLKNLK